VFTHNNKYLLVYAVYFQCWAEMERRLTDMPDPKSPRQKAFDEGNV